MTSEIERIEYGIEVNSLSAKEEKEVNGSLLL